jgi:hypothetical protein
MGKQSRKSVTVNCGEKKAELVTVDQNKPSNGTLWWVGKLA